MAAQARSTRQKREVVVEDPDRIRSLALAGKYRLTAARWRQVHKFAATEPQDLVFSRAGRPCEWTDHVRGDLVDLDQVTADRLLRARAVEPTTDEQRKDPKVAEALSWQNPLAPVFRFEPPGVRPAGPGDAA